MTETRMWTVHWTMDGFTDVPAPSAHEALEVFEAMRSARVLDRGDHQLPRATVVKELLVDGGIMVYGVPAGGTAS